MECCVNSDYRVITEKEIVISECVDLNKNKDILRPIAIDLFKLEREDRIGIFMIKIFRSIQTRH